MDAIQPALAVLFVLGLLGGTLYWLRTKGLARFSGKGFAALGNRAGKQMQTIERQPLTPQHSLHLVNVRGRTLLVAVSPGGCTVVDGIPLPASPENIVGHR
jgi:flagellar biogenesis protein FliO